MENGINPNQYVVSLDIFNLTNNAQVTVDIRNGIGDLKHEMSVTYVPLPIIDQTRAGNDVQ